MTEPPPPRLSWGARLGLLFGILAGPAYLVWVTGIEGTRVLVVTGILLLIAGCAALAHWLMGLTRTSPPDSLSHRPPGPRERGRPLPPEDGVSEAPASAGVPPSPGRGEGDGRGGPGG